MQTNLVWSYKPIDFFEAPTPIVFGNGTADFVDGEITYRLSNTADPVPQGTLEAATEEVLAALSVRRLLNRRRFSLNGPNIVQVDVSGNRHITLIGQPAVVTGKATVGILDVVLTDSAGNVVSDSKAERIKEHTSFVSDLAPKVLKSPTLRVMVQSCNAAQDDPANELVYLYEVRDAVVKHFGNESTARTALKITKMEWQRLGRLANVEPLHEGRHRGSHIGALRHASENELSAARTVARKIIDAFATTV